MYPPVASFELEPLVDAKAVVESAGRGRGGNGGGEIENDYGGEGGSSYGGGGERRGEGSGGDGGISC